MLTRYFFFLLFAAFLSLSLLSCGICSKKIDCPGYKDDTLDSWFPYHDNQQLVFRSNTNLADTFVLKTIEVTEPYQITTGSFAGPRGCIAWKRFEGAGSGTSEQRTAAINLSTQEDGLRTVSFAIGNNNFGIYNFKKDGFGQVTSGSRNMVPQAQPVVTIGGVAFYNVIEVLGDTTGNKTAGLYKIYYKQGEGLVSYSEYPSLQTWIKQ